MNGTISSPSSNLYVLLFPEKSALKIGKANNVLKRCASLAWLGKPDLQKSYQITMPEKRVFEVETAFHLLLKESRLNVGDGSGHSEIFNIDCLPRVIEYLKAFVGNSSLNAGIKKLPQAKKMANQTREKELESIRAYQFEQDLIEIRKLVNRISKVVRFFIKKSDSIPYQIVSEPNRSIFFKSDSWPIVKRLIQACQPSGGGVSLRAHLDGLHLNILPYICVTEPGLLRVDIFSCPAISSKEKMSHLLIPLESMWSDLDNLLRVSPVLEKPLCP